MTQETACKVKPFFNHQNIILYFLPKEKTLHLPELYDGSLSKWIGRILKLDFVYLREKNVKYTFVKVTDHKNSFLHNFVGCTSRLLGDKNDRWEINPYIWEQSYPNPRSIGLAPVTNVFYSFPYVVPCNLHEFYYKQVILTITNTPMTTASTLVRQLRKRGTKCLERSTTHLVCYLKIINTIFFLKNNVCILLKAHWWHWNSSRPSGSKQSKYCFDQTFKNHWPNKF